MSESESKVPFDDPFRVLGLNHGATEEEIRKRYLHLVKMFPPEREPDRFQAIHQAFNAVKDPIAHAKFLIDATPDAPRAWKDVLAEQKARIPRINVNTLLSLGNREFS